MSKRLQKRWILNYTQSKNQTPKQTAGNLRVFPTIEGFGQGKLDSGCRLTKSSRPRFHPFPRESFGLPGGVQKRTYSSAAQWWILSRLPFDDIAKQCQTVFVFPRNTMKYHKHKYPMYHSPNCSTWTCKTCTPPETTTGRRKNFCSFPSLTSRGFEVAPATKLCVCRWTDGHAHDL